MYSFYQNKLYIIDFNPWGPMTDGLLFDWPELLTLSLQVTKSYEMQFKRTVMIEEYNVNIISQKYHYCLCFLVEDSKYHRTSTIFLRIPIDPL